MGLTNSQLIAVRLMNDGYSPTDVARQMHVTNRDVYAWNANPAFMQERYKDMVLRFGEAVPAAMKTIMDIMENDPKGATRLKAATEILDRAGFTPKRNVDISLSDSGPSMLNMDVAQIKSLLSSINKELNAIDVTPESDQDTARDASECTQNASEV